jgi:hypothetical protein
MPDGVSGARRGTLLPVLLQALLVVVLVAAVGALAGVVWERVWTPPTGVVVRHQWVASSEGSLRGEFTGTGWYVVVAGVAGLLVGAVVALVADRRPLVSLASLVVGTVLGAWLMRVVGVALGPGDPTTLARTARQGAHLPDMLRVSGASPYVAYPTGALLALAILFLGLSAVRKPDHER